MRWPHSLEALFNRLLENSKSLSLKGRGQGLLQWAQYHLKDPTHQIGLAALVGCCLVVGLMSGMTFAIAPVGPPALIQMGLYLGLAMLPFSWVIFWKKSHWLLILVTYGMILGDVAASVVAPFLLSVTSPDCLRLMWKYRRHPMLWLVSPFILMAVLYIPGSALVGVSDQPLAMTRDMIYSMGVPQLHLGPAALALGVMILYPIIYIPLLVLEVHKTRPKFLYTFIIISSVLINLIALGGVLEFIQSPDKSIRVASIMRLPTRLGPFLLVFTAVCFPLVFRKQKWQSTAYWAFSVLLNSVVIFMTFTRIAIAVMVLLVGVYAFMFFLSGYKELLKKMAIGVIGVAIVGLASASASGANFLERFDPDNVGKGNEDRDLIHEDWWDAALAENISPSIAVLHNIFGWGIFRERNLAHFNIHSTPLCVFAATGGLGFFLYFLPYGIISAYIVQRLWVSHTLETRLLNSSAGGVILSFLTTGLYHNKFYSPIETGFIWLMAVVLLMMADAQQRGDSTGDWLIQSAGLGAVPLPRATRTPHTIDIPLEPVQESPTDEPTATRTREKRALPDRSISSRLTRLRSPVRGRNSADVLPGRSARPTRRTSRRTGQ